MKKFECAQCYKKCQAMVNIEPKFCLLFGDKADWHEVKEETTQQFGNSEQLPDWVKVGKWVYDTTIKEYGCIKKDESKGWYFEHIEDGTIIQAHKRPFNEAETKALVGKVLSDSSGEWRSLIIGASGDEVSTYHRSYSANTLSDGGYVVDGKPCFKLEHLNKKGERVK